MLGRLGDLIGLRWWKRWQQQQQQQQQQQVPKQSLMHNECMCHRYFAASSLVTTVQYPDSYDFLEYI
jgi:hypothetical protein